MKTEMLSPGEATMHILRLTRFAITCTLALATVLLLGDFAGAGWSTASLRFMSETVVIFLVGAIALEVGIAIDAVTCIWRLSYAPQ